MNTKTVVGVVVAIVVVLALAAVLRPRTSAPEPPLTSPAALSSPAPAASPKAAPAAPLSPPPGATATTIGDKSGLFTAEIPVRWTQTTSEGPKGGQLSRVIVVSPDFYAREGADEGPFIAQHYERGGQIAVHVTRGNLPDNYSGVIRTEPVTVGGVSATLITLREPSTFTGQLMKVTVPYQGNDYNITLIYNPEASPHIEPIFRAFLDSFRFGPS